MIKNKKILKTLLAIVAGVLLFLPVYTSGYSVYEVHADTTTNSNDDQNKKKPGGDGIGIPGIGGGSSIGSGATTGGTTGTTLGAGTTLTNPQSVSLSGSQLRVSANSTAQNKALQQFTDYVKKHTITRVDSNGAVTQITSEKTIALALQQPGVRKSGLVPDSVAKSFAKTNKAFAGIKWKWHGKKSKGNFTVTMSKGFIRFAKAMIAAGRFVAFIVQMYLGSYVGAGIQFAKSIQATIKAANSKNGLKVDVKRWIHFKSKKTLLPYRLVFGLLN